MQLERPELFQNRRDWLYFIVLLLFISLMTLGLEYYRFLSFKTFSTVEMDARVIHQYSKGEQTLLKVKAEQGSTFFIKADTSIRDLQGYDIRIDAYTGHIGFMEYLKGSYLSAWITRVYPERASRYDIAESIASQHTSQKIGSLFAALVVATPMHHEIREVLAALGVSHLVAISGFHLGLITLFMFALLKPLYGVAYRYWFPYRHKNRDIFFMVAIVLLGYVIYLEYVPSVLRAFAMMVIGFVLYDRGIKVVSYQTLLVSVLVLLALFPRLAFSIGFGLSVSGVFFILLFLHHFGEWKRWQQFIGMHVWVYMMMLPVSLSLFETFDVVHLLSIGWTMLFMLFYPVALGLHLIGEGGLLESAVISLLGLPTIQQVTMAPATVVVHGVTALLAVRYRWAVWLLLLLTLTIVVYAVDQVT